MKLILEQDLKKLGKKGDIVEVSDGYARNFLLPKGFALIVNEKSINELKGKKDSEIFKFETKKKEAEDVFQAIDGKQIKILAKSGASGKIFGKVTAKEIQEAINKNFNIEVDKRKIKLEEDIKSFGVYECRVKIFENITAMIKVQVSEEQ